MTLAHRRALAAAAAALALATPLRAETCVKELRPDDFAGTTTFRMTCGAVGLTLQPIESQMYYHRWLVTMELRSAGAAAEARVNLAAFDADGKMIGAHGFAARDLKERTRSIVFRMEAMYRSTADTSKLVLSLSLPERKPR